MTDQDEPSILLHRVEPGGELMEVATGQVVQPKSKDMHNIKMDKNVMRVNVSLVVPEFRDIAAPINLRA